MKFISIRIGLLLTMLAPCYFTMAQNMNMPYSLYGLGEIDRKPYDRTQGMGGTGLALQSPFYALQANPAATSALVRSFYQIDFAATGKTLTYQGQAIDADNSNNKDFWIKRLGLTFKLTDRWASGIGFSQFSNVNYNLTGTRTITGSTENYNTQQTGDGGLTEYYWNNAYRVGKRLALGIRSSILAGSINATETISDAGLNEPVTTSIQDYMASARFRFGAQYALPMGKNWNLGLGAVYSPRVKLIAERTLTVTEGNESLVSDEFLTNYNRYVPQTWGGGLVLKYRDKVSYAVDFNHEDWSANLISGKGWQMRSSNRISAGVEWSRRMVSANQYIEKNFFQVGAYYDQGSLQVKNQGISEWGISAGLGGILGRNLLYTVAVEGGQRGTTSYNLIRENFFQLSFTFSYRDFLYSKGRKYE
ncbi:MAG: hypothetical protein ACK4E0_00600 [Chitinophagaceae bacterium]